MIGNILTKNEYQEIVDHCRGCKSGYAIKDFVDDIFRQYREFNTSLETSLMEYMELNYKELKGDGELANGGYANLKEEIPEYTDPALEYLFSYLVLIGEKESRPDQKKRDSSTVSFKLKDGMSESQLEGILYKLQEKKYCDFTSMEKIRWVFLDEPKEAADEKIQWIDIAPKSKEGSYQTLIDFLDSVCVGSHIDLAACQHTDLFLKELN